MGDINQCYEMLKYRATKAGFNGNIAPSEFNLIFPRAERRYFNKQYKQYELSQEIGESLLPYKTNPIVITPDGTGKYTKPLDILHIDSIRVPYNGLQSEVMRFTDDRLANKLSSQYDAPTVQFPIYVDYNTYLQFYPNVTTANLVYLQKLTDSKWGYTLVNNRPVYDVSTSVQPKWKDSDLDEILYIALSDIAINMKDGQLQQFSELKIKTDL